MSHRHKKQRLLPDIGLFMECEEENLSPVQSAYYKSAKNEYEGFQQKLDAYVRKTKGEVVLEEGDYSLFKINHSAGNASSSYSQPFVLMDKGIGIVVTPNSNQVQSGKNSVVRQIKPSPTINLPPITKPVTRGSRGTSETSRIDSPGSSQSRSTRNTRAPPPPPSLPVTRSSRGASQAEVVPISRGTRAATAVVEQPGVYTPIAASGSVATNCVLRKGVKPLQQTGKPSASTALGGLSIGSKHPPKLSIFMFEGDRSEVDCKEVVINKTSGKTFPSLVVVARPHLQVKSTLASAQTERANLDVQVKGALMYTTAKFTEWLIRQGLIRSEQECRLHMKPDGSAIPLKLGVYSDVTKFPYSGGYVWVSDCCPTVFVSVFFGSIFEASLHPPTVLLKLLYHWACQTNVQNVVQWVKVEPVHVKNVYTMLRAICSYAVSRNYGKLGGHKKKVEMGLISLGTASTDGSMKHVTVEVLGVMDPETKFVRLRALEPASDERQNKRRWSSVLKPMKDWIEPDSTILIDFTIDKETILGMGFKHVSQSETKPANTNIMEYLRKIVPKMFQNTLSLLNRAIIQQFLDELVWRERWGPIASLAFNQLIADIKALTLDEKDGNILGRLHEIALDPLCLSKQKAHAKAQASISKVKPESPATPTERRGRKRTAEVEPVIDVTSPSGTPPVKKSARIATSKEKEKKVKLPGLDKYYAPQPMVDLSEEVTSFLAGADLCLESYYYGTLPDNDWIGKKEVTLLNVKCAICLKSFNDSMKLMKHALLHCQTKPQIHSNLKKIHQCDSCFLGFNTLTLLRSHVRDVHTQPSEGKQFICQICDKLHADNNQFVYHMHRYHVALEMPYACGVCKFRSSSYDVIIKHLTLVHKGSHMLFCPFCLKVVTIADKGKLNMFYMKHILKHARRKCRAQCHKCKLSFVNDLVLVRHLEKDHVSLEPNKDIIQLVGLPETMMPKPGNLIKPAPKPRRPQIPDAKKAYTENGSEHINCVITDSDLDCAECEGPLSSTDHFTEEYSCSKCPYRTRCEFAMMEHCSSYHETESSALGKSANLSEPVHCACGFFTCSGNSMAKHLISCKKRTVYASEATAMAVRLSTMTAAERRAFQRSKQAGEPNVLNMLGLVRKSPEHEVDLVHDEVAESLNRLFHPQEAKKTDEEVKESQELPKPPAPSTPPVAKEDVVMESPMEAKEDKTTGDLIAELEDMMDADVPAGDSSTDFMSDLIPPSDP